MILHHIRLILLKNTALKLRSFAIFVRQDQTRDTKSYSGLSYSFPIVCHSSYRLQYYSMWEWMYHGITTEARHPGASMYFVFSFDKVICLIMTYVQSTTVINIIMINVAVVCCMHIYLIILQLSWSSNAIDIHKIHCSISFNIQRCTHHKY